MSKETTLARVELNGLFYFGGVWFIKKQATTDHYDDLLLCQIRGHEKFVYISNSAIVEVNN